MNFSGDDLRLDEKTLSETVTASCRRAGLYIEGIAAFDDRITLICSSCNDVKERVYRFSQLGKTVSFSELAAELRTRYDASFRSVGAFMLDDGMWLLTEKS